MLSSSTLRETSVSKEEPYVNQHEVSLEIDDSDRLDREYFKMASEENGSSYWGQLIFTHDSKPPVLISKDLIRLGRKEGKSVTWTCFLLIFDL